MKKAHKNSSLFWAISFCSVFASAAENPIPTRFVPEGELLGTQLNWDNDVWAPGRTDQWYTNGTRFSWTYKNTPTTKLAGAAVSLSKLLLPDRTENTLTYTIGQSLYSPRDITQIGVQRDDRPWGAFLYFGLTNQVVTGLTYQAADLKVGLTGNLAFGEAVQSSIHTLISSARPAGWANQVGQRVGVQLSYAQVNLVERSFFGNDFLNKHVNLQWGWGGAVGTLRANANVAATVLVGDLERLDKPKTPILIGNEGDFVTQPTSNEKVVQNAYAYLSLGATAVAYNYFINGTTPYGSSDIKPIPGYLSAQVGVSLPLRKWIANDWPRLVYALTVRSSEFETNSSGPIGRPQRWGTFTLNWDY